ncbi:MAG: DUF932 domain-containing protein [Deltaproteobacteria bacterium]|nr:DUF932 domain-containing protein [Deltaproteobacteria bacterium]
MNKSENDQTVTFPVVQDQPVACGPYGNMKAAPRHRAIVNQNTGKVYSIVSMDYQLIRHEDAILEVEQAINETPELIGRREISTQFYNDGGRMCRKYCFPQISVEIGPNDFINPELNLFNSYDVTWPFHILLGAFRIVCSNGLVVGKKFFQLRKRHVYGLQSLNLKEEVSSAMELLTSQTKQWQRWADKRLTGDQHGNVMKAMNFGLKATGQIESRVQREADGYTQEGLPIMSIWIFFNILSWYVTHRAVSLNHRVTMENRLRHAASEYLD